MAGKRGNGEGSIRQRANGLWEARALLDGESKSVYGKTRQEVARKLAAVIRDHHRGLAVIRDERQTVGAFLESSLETMRPPKLAQTTWERYEELVRLHITPVIGKVAVARLAP